MRKSVGRKVTLFVSKKIYLLYPVLERYIRCAHNSTLTVIAYQ